MNTSKLKMDLEILLDDELEVVKGGSARVLSSEKEKSKEGDGAEYVCCIEINFPKR